MSNFKFLKSVDKNLYEIITEAEKLYRDEYFEQSITQTRRFGEIVCKNVLGSARTNEKTFDDMLATLKDRVSNAIQEKEFIEDLYFLKREGNASVHASCVKKNAITALECLQRAFEISINYTVYYKKMNSKLLKQRFDTELLITGEKSQKTLKERYKEEKQKSDNSSSKKIKKTTSKKKTTKDVKRKSLFCIVLGLSFIISLVLILTIFLLSLI